MMKKIGTLLLIGIIGTAPFFSALPCWATTSAFSTSSPYDTKSYRTVKDDSEQNFYMSMTSHEKPVTLHGTSIKLNDHSVYSNKVVFYPGEFNFERHNNYVKYARAKELYYLETSTSQYGVRVTGLYTP